MANIWDDQEPFRDSPVEFKSGGWKDTDTYTPAPDNTLKRSNNVNFKKQEVEEPMEEELETLIEEVSQEEDEDYTEVLSDARLRLEQGRLYEMIIQHNLFENLDADPRAIKSVQNQIRKFARERMEIMLGIRQEETTATNTFVSSPFNDLEVTILKKLASAASKGATETEEANATQEFTPVPIPKKKTTLSSIGPSKPKQMVQPKPIQKKAEPIKRVQKQNITQPAISDADYKPIDKPLHEMTQAELAERDRQALERQKGRVSAIPKDRAPPADYATQEMLAHQQVNRAVGNPTKGNLSALIMANLKSSGKI